jgi:hypothetical protein
MNLDTLWGLVVGGACTGLGSALGNFLAQWSFIRHFTRLTESLKKDKNDER